MPTESKTGSPNIGNLLKKTKIHPKGRVKIDPETGDVVNPKTPTTGTFTAVTQTPTGPQQIEVVRLTGHATVDGVWRSAFSQGQIDLGFQTIKGDSPQALYHEMKTASERRKKLGRDWDFLPELTEPELKSYYTWCVENKKELSADDQEKAKALGVSL